MRLLMLKTSLMICWQNYLGILVIKTTSSAPKVP
jgi:hypothetical protein